MSIYSFEEICKGCEYVIWHNCDYCFEDRKHFCHCSTDHECDVSHMTGRCEFKFKLSDLRGGYECNKRL